MSDQATCPKGDPFCTGEPHEFCESIDAAGPPPEVITPTPEERARASIDRIIDATDRLAWCTAAVQARADGRAAEKSAAIRRLMQTTNEETGKPHSASSAEKVVELDPAFAQYRQTEAACEVERIRALGVYEAAKLVAELDVALVAPMAREG